MRAIPALAVVLLAASSLPATEVEPRAHAIVGARIVVAPGQVLSLDKVVVQPWDQVLLVGPYTPNALIQKATGGGMPAEMGAIEIDKRDDVNVLIFMRGGKASTAVALPRRVADFDKADLLRPTDRKNAQDQAKQS